MEQLRQSYPAVVELPPFDCSLFTNQSSYNNWKDDGSKEYKHDGD
jgi:hypothetical protein